MTLGIAIAGFVATVAAAFGGAWYGGRLQRNSNMETLGRQVQINAAARFIAAVGDALLVLLSAPADDWSSLAIVGITVQQSALAIVGPDELAEIASQIEDQVLTAVKQAVDVRREALGKIATLSEQFEQRATVQLRPAAGQKNGRNRSTGIGQRGNKPL